MSLGTAFIYMLGILSAISVVATAVILVVFVVKDGIDDPYPVGIRRYFPELFLGLLGIQCLVVAIGASAYIVFLWLTSELPKWWALPFCLLVVTMVTIPVAFSMVEADVRKYGD
jgi:hypothetical protein